MPHFNSKKQKGQLAEWLAVIFLLCAGYRPLHHNFKGPFAQVDIIAQKGKTLIVVEVKFRQNAAEPTLSIHPTQTARLLRQAHALQQAYGANSARLDAIFITPTFPFIQHVKGLGS